jgi:hypothetical protein
MAEEWETPDEVEKISQFENDNSLKLSKRERIIYHFGYLTGQIKARKEKSKE